MQTTPSTFPPAAPSSNRAGWERARSRRTRVQAVTRSVMGRSREKNEDRSAALPEIGLFMVADGMGGHAYGEVAATIAVTAVRECFEEPDLQPHTFGPIETAGEAITRLVAAVKRANRIVCETAAASELMHDMGSTFTAALIRGSTLCIAHVGDSRVYRMRGGSVTRLTEDHTLAASYVRRGLSPEAAATMPYANALTRSLGEGPVLQVDARMEDLMPGDVVLLCTDGLSNVLSSREIAVILNAHRDLDAAADALLSCAAEAGSYDDTTVVLFRWGEL